MPYSNVYLKIRGLLGLLLLMLSSYCAYCIFHTHQIAKHQDKWLPTEAIVTKSREEVSSSAYDTVIECHLHYEYVVAGKRFDSTLYDVAGGSCRDILPLKRGDVIEAYYNPNNPNLAVVERRPISLLPLVLAGGMPVVFLGWLGIAVLIDVINAIRNFRRYN